MMNSIWSDNNIPKRNPLPGDRSCQAAVIGGGMAGMLTAYCLQERGIPTIVLEADRIGSGQTGSTTAKITSQHNLIYERLIRTLGLEQARAYADANQQALREYRRLIEKNHIFCDYQEETAYLYSTTVSEPLRREAEAASRLGIEADFITTTELPFSVHGALSFPGQVQFHPLRFLQAISMPLTVYEQTKVLSVKGRKVITNRGTVTADFVVFACHYPFINVPGFYFARMYQKRSYVLALRQAPVLHGMYLGIEQEGLSFRQAGDYLLVGGRGHRTGSVPSGNPYKSLQQAAAHLFPGNRTAAHWSAQDCMTIDGIPYIGRFSPSTPNWYVATGFGKWGMSSSMVAAMILSDLICGKKNPYASVFSPSRLHLKASVRDGISHMGHSVKGLLAGTSKQALRCPHLGCKLAWNSSESTWECPCHGSRFHYTGKRLNGPAQTDVSFP